MLNLPVILKQIESVAEQPPPITFAQAAINDFLMSCSLSPLTPEVWGEVLTDSMPSKHELKLMAKKNMEPPFAKHQIPIIAVWGLGTDLYSQTRDGYRTRNENDDSKEILTKLFLRLRGVPGEIMSRVRFRQEEALRAWAAAFALSIAGETESESHAKLLRLDYFGVMAEALKAETAHEAKHREAALKRMKEEAAAAAAAASRGSYE